MGIRTKLLLLFAVVAGVPMALIAVVSYRHSVRSVETLVEEQALASTREITDALTGRLDEALELFDVLASNQEIDDLYAGRQNREAYTRSLGRVERFYSQLFARSPSRFGRVRYVDLDGHPLLEYPRTPEAAPGDPSLAGRDDAGDAERIDLSPYGPQQAVSLTDEYEPQLGAVLRLASRIHRFADGRATGWVLADLPATPLLAGIMSQRPAVRDRRVMVVEGARGRLLYHPSDTFVGQGLAQVSPEVAAALASTPSANGQIRLGIRGRQSLVAWAGLEGPDWIVISVSPRSPAAAAVRQAGAYILSVTAIAFVVTGVLILLVIARITGSIRQVAEGARSIAAGDLEQQIAVHTRDETRDLADSFNHMATSLRQTMGQLQQLNEELEGRVQRRTRDLQARTTDLEQANEQLEQLNQALALANDQVREATRHKSEFLSRMSHDLRTPMNAIIGYTRILLRRASGILDDRQYRNLESIQTSADNLLNLINEILDLSRIEAGRIEIEPEPVQVGALVGECITSVAPLVRSEVELIQEVEEARPVNTDPERLRRVVMNLLGNAVKFTESGRITVSLQPTETGVELAVADTGVGIPPDDLPDIFEEFRQVERQVGEKKEGTGLGLAIAARSVEMLGGTISAESEVGQGTTFSVRIGDYGGSRS